MVKIDFHAKAVLSVSLYSLEQKERVSLFAGSKRR